MASYFPEAGNLNGRRLTCARMWLGRRVAVRGICLSFQIGQILCTFSISPTTSTTGRQLAFERDYNYHTAFRGCNVIMHKVYWVNLRFKARGKYRQYRRSTQR